MPPWSNFETKLQVELAIISNFLTFTSFTEQVDIKRISLEITKICWTLKESFKKVSNFSVSSSLYAASKLDKHEQWVESAGTCQKASQIKKSHFTNQAITEL